MRKWFKFPKKGTTLMMRSNTFFGFTYKNIGNLL